MNCKVCQLFFVAIFVLVPSIALAQTLLPEPDPYWVPVPPNWPPVGQGHPGGEALPQDWDVSAVSPYAPVIGSQTDTTYPNETIGMLGDQLLNADFAIWAEGRVFRAEALRTASDRAQLPVPARVIKSDVLFAMHDTYGLQFHDKGFPNLYNNSSFPDALADGLIVGGSASDGMLRTSESGRGIEFNRADGAPFELVSFDFRHYLEQGNNPAPETQNVRIVGTDANGAPLGPVTFEISDANHSGTVVLNWANVHNAYIEYYNVPSGVYWLSFYDDFVINDPSVPYDPASQVPTQNVTIDFDDPALLDVKIADGAEYYSSGGGAGSVAKSTMLIWPENTYGYGMPIRINAPVVHWVWPNTEWENASSQTVRVFRIFGKNFKLTPGVTPVVLAVNAAQGTTQLTVLSHSENEIVAQYPSNYSLGTASVWVHNGTGGKYGWGGSESFDISQNSYDTTTHEVHVDDPAWANLPTDRQKIQKAINVLRGLAASGASGGLGGTIRFADRTYDITYQIKAAAVASGTIDIPIVFKGTTDPITGDIATKLVYAGATSDSSDSKNMILSGNGSGVEDLELVGVRLEINASDIAINNVVITDVRDNAVHLPSIVTSENILFDDCVFNSRDTGVQASNVRYIRFSDCHFVGSYNNKEWHPTESARKVTDNHGIGTRDVCYMIVEDCDFRSADPLSASIPNYPKILTRGIVAFRNWDSNHYIANNKFEWTGSFLGVGGGNINTGEVIMYHGEDDTTHSYHENTTATDTAASIDDIYLDLSYDDFDPTTPVADEVAARLQRIAEGSIWIYVTSGRAAGQFRQIDGILSHSGGTQVRAILKKRWQDAIPASGDKIVVREFCANNIIVGNHIDPIPEGPAFDNSITPEECATHVNGHSGVAAAGFKRTGILLWTGCYGTTIADNFFAHTRTGIRINYTGDEEKKWSTGGHHIRGNVFCHMIPTLDNPNHSTKVNDHDMHHTDFFTHTGRDQVPLAGGFYSSHIVFRDNFGIGAEFATSVGGDDHDLVRYPRNDNTYTANEVTGVVNTILENNVYRELSHGFSQAVSTRSNWTLLRNNQSEVVPSVDIHTQNNPVPNKVIDLLYVGRWFDDALPEVPASPTPTYPLTWTTDDPLPHSGEKSHVFAEGVTGLQTSAFSGAAHTLNVSTGDTLYCWVWINPVDPPSAIMIGWEYGTTTEYASWGNSDLMDITSGINSDPIDDVLPPTGAHEELEWHRFDVPASTLSLEGEVVTGMVFHVLDGSAAFDDTGLIGAN